MKKATLQKTVAVALTGAMVVGSLVGCNKDSGANNETTTAGSSTETTTAATGNNETETTTAAPSNAVGMEGWTAFSENVTLQIPVYDRGASGNGVSDVVNNYWTNWVQEEFGDKWNITVEYVPIPRNEVLQEYSLLAMAEDLPTICAEYDYPKLMQWLNDGYLQSYDVELFKQIAPTYWQNMVDNGLDSYTSNADGEDYFVLGMRPYGNTNYTFVTWYRLDWVKAAGFDEYPGTWEEEKQMLQYLVDNGIAEHPLGGSKIAGAGVDQNYGYRTYPQDEITWATTGDYNIPALGTEAQYWLIKRENEAYNLGYKDPEYAEKDASAAQSDFINGKVISYSAYISSNVEVLNSFYAQNPDAELAVRVCPGVYFDEEGHSSSAFRPNNIFGMMIGFSHDATEDEVKAAMMYLEWLSQPDVLFTFQWGNEGENYNMVDGAPVAVADQTGLESRQGHNNNVDYWCMVTASKSLGTIEDDVAAANPQGLPQDFYDQLVANYYGQLEVYNAGYAQSDCLFAAAIEAEGEFSASLAELYAVYRNQLTKCDPAEFDDLYEKLSQEYLEAGYQEVIDGRLEAYEAGQSTKLPQ